MPFLRYASKQTRRQPDRVTRWYRPADRMPTYWSQRTESGTNLFFSLVAIYWLLAAAVSNNSFATKRQGHRWQWRSVVLYWHCLGAGTNHTCTGHIQYGIAHMGPIKRGTFGPHELTPIWADKWSQCGVTHVGSQNRTHLVQMSKRTWALYGLPIYFPCTYDHMSHIGPTELAVWEGNGA